MAKNQRMWTEKEIAFLEKHNGSKPISYIAKYLNRSPMSVRHKCYSLGMGSPTELDYFTTGYIANMLGCTASAIQKRILKGDLKVRGKVLGDRAYISRKDFRKFWEKNKTARLFSDVDPDKLNWLLYG